MPGMSMSMGMYQSQRMEQRMQLAQRMEMRLEQRLELSLRQILIEHMILDAEGVVDPGRVRFFDLPLEKGSIPVAAKIVQTPADPYREAINMRACAGHGMATPELLGVGESNGTFFMLTRFNPDVLNCATALTKGSDLAQTYCAHVHLQVASVLEASIERAQSDTTQTAEYIRDLGQRDLAGLIIDKEAFPSPFKEYHEPVLYDRVAIALGRELARLHRAGVDKLDITPRNLLLRLTPEGEVSFIHTGFREVAFSDRALPKQRRKEQLEALQREFAAMNPEAAAQYACCMIRGYFAEYYGRTLDGAEDPATVQQETRTATEEALQEQGDAEMEAKPALTPVVVECRQIVLDLPLDQLTTQKVGEEICAVVERAVAIENIGYDEQRPRKQLRWLYQQWKEKGSAKCEDLEYAPSEIAVDCTTASRQIKPIVESLGVPLPSEMLRSLREVLILRFAQEHPECTGNELFQRIRVSAPELMQTLEIGNERTLRKYTKQLRDSGLIHDLNKRDANKVIDLIAKWFNDGKMLVARECAAELSMDEAAVRPLVLCLKQRYLRRGLAMAKQSQTPIDIAALACVLDLPFAEVEQAAIKAGINSTPRSIEHPVEAEPETPRTENLNHAPVVEHIEVAVSPVEQVQIEVPPAPPVQPIIQVQETAEESVDERLLSAVEEDVMRSDRALAEMCGCSVPDVQTRLRQIFTLRNLDGRRREVERLIQTEPGIEDDGIQERTGLSVVDIHLILRPFLQNGDLRAGTPH